MRGPISSLRRFRQCNSGQGLHRVGQGQIQECVCSVSPSSAGGHACPFQSGCRPGQFVKRQRTGVGESSDLAAEEEHSPAPKQRDFRARGALICREL